MLIGGGVWGGVVKAVAKSKRCLDSAPPCYLSQAMQLTCTRTADPYAADLSCPALACAHDAFPVYA